MKTMAFKVASYENYFIKCLNQYSSSYQCMSHQSVTYQQRLDMINKYIIHKMVAVSASCSLLQDILKSHKS